MMMVTETMTGFSEAQVLKASVFIASLGLRVRQTPSFSPSDTSGFGRVDRVERNVLPLLVDCLRRVEWNAT